MADDPPLMDRGEHPFLYDLTRRLRASRTNQPRSGSAKLLVDTGDDAAVFQPGAHPIAITTDALVEEVHFRRDWILPHELGRRSIEVNFSDLAAMGARPFMTLAAIEAPAATPTAWLDAILEGCADASDDAGANLAGGNLTQAETFAITITALGEIPGRILERTGARPGDDLIVTGKLGDAAAAVAAWRQGHSPQPEQRDRWKAPRARIHAGLALAKAGAHAAIDLSDGLMADLGHLCAASDIGAEIQRDALPRTDGIARLDARGADFAATGGEDYELLIACPPEVTANLGQLSDAAQVELTVIGHCTEATGQILLRGSNQEPVEVGRGFDHFANRRGG